ncbi:HK97 family phage prohead protease [uncultured Clostridium sp.]|uniref:HK97 family phage prohead protease n=1 Tax=uncultured Clostridium sp. TaxID=59620 RepID=UPI0025F02D04|nr:HK97 family phage prohead protease [uncultured Clostridium sp.]
MNRSYVTIDDIEIRVLDNENSLFLRAFLPTEKLSHNIYDKKERRFFKEKVCKGVFLNCIDRENLKILLNHNYKKEIQVKDIDIYEKSEGLYVEATVVPSEELLLAIEEDLITGVSYGFIVGLDKFEKVDGEWIRTIISFSKIMEISILFVDFQPCYPLASAIVCNNKEDVPKEEVKALKKAIQQMREESASHEIERMKSALNRLKGKGRY